MKDSQIIELEVLCRELNQAHVHRLATHYQIQNEQALPTATKFDQLFKRVLKICRKNCGEVDIGHEELVWYIVLDTLIGLKSAPEFKEDEHFKTFFNTRITMFVFSLIENIPFKNFLEHALTVTHDLQYGDLQDIILNLFSDKRCEMNVTNNAKNTIVKVNADMFESYQQLSGYGLLFRSLRCMICRGFFDGFITGDYAPPLLNEEGDEIYVDPMDDIKIF
jgi:hypothetical protein